MKPRVGLFVTCLVDLMRPSIGFAAAKLLEEAGCIVEVPTQTCCGQPAFNSGDRATARDLAQQVIEAFEGFDYVVVPSGSCGGQISRHFPELFADQPEFLGRARALAEKTFELMHFLVEIRGMRGVSARFNAKATYHDSCSGLRELGVKKEPRKLLATVSGLTLVEMPECETCCGFGGTFAVKYAQISDEIVSKKVENIEKSGADFLIAGDLGCLLNMAGKMRRLGKPIRALHVAEVLADMGHEPAIGEPRRGRAP